MHLRLGQAARYDAQDQTSRHRPRRRRFHAQSDRLQPGPHSQTGGGIGRTLSAPQSSDTQGAENARKPRTKVNKNHIPPQKRAKTACFRGFFSKLLEEISRAPLQLTPAERALVLKYLAT